MKRIFYFFIVTFVFFSCKPKQVLTDVSIQKFKLVYPAKMGQLIDVRTAEENKLGTIEGALLIDVMKQDFVKRALSKLDKNKSVYVFCRSGVRSVKAANLLVKAGFKKVYNLKGGYNAWSEIK